MSVALPQITTVRPGRTSQEGFDSVRLVASQGAAELLNPYPGLAERESLHIAVLIPPFSEGSGGHNTIFRTVKLLEDRGHTCSVWLHDPLFRQGSDWNGYLRQKIRDFFQPVAAPAFNGFSDWYGADVVVATGWPTVYKALLLERCYARAYLVNDYEVTFDPTSAESLWAEQSYRFGMHCITASTWLAELLGEHYGAKTTPFALGVDHAVYHPHEEIDRRSDTIAFYCRPSTPRRGVALATLALSELLRRRPQTRIVMYGDRHPLWTSFDHEHAGLATPAQLAQLYAEATVGLSLSMTNISLVPKEMLACGLPCVELAGVSAESEFGADGPVELAPFDPIGLADSLERLLSDPDLRARRAAAGIEFVRDHTWESATDRVELGLREALRLRMSGSGQVPGL